jgi:predicted ATP-dependent endonuclease of OLD family
MYISRFKLKNWKNFQSIDIRLEPRVFLVGPNASGKSNLLDAIRFLRDLTKTGGGLQYAIDQRSGVSKLRFLSARSSPEVSIGVELSEDSKKMKWKYELAFGQIGGGIRKPKARIKSEKVWSGKGPPLLNRPDEYPNDQKDDKKSPGIQPDEVILLQPDKEGTIAFNAPEDKEIRSLLEGGMNIADAVVPASAPNSSPYLPN